MLIDVKFAGRGATRPLVYYDPSLNNSGKHDSGWTEGDALVAVDGNKASALMSSCGFSNPTNGYLNASQASTRVDNGNVVQMAGLKGLETGEAARLRSALVKRPPRLSRMRELHSRAGLKTC